MQTIIFLRKEFVENTRNKKLLIVLLLSLVIGFMSPAIAKLTPDIIGSLVDKKIAEIIPEPSMWDSWTQFYKNVTQLLFVIFIILCADSLTKELKDKTLVPLVTKGLKKQAVLNAKALFLSLTLLTLLGLSAIITASYSYLVFGSIDKSMSLLPFVDLGLFSLLLVAALLLGSVIVSGYGTILVVGGTVLMYYLIGIPSKLTKYSPINLIVGNVERMQSGVTLDWRCYLVVICLLVLFIFLTHKIFNKKMIV